MEIVTIFEDKLYSFKDENTDSTKVSYLSEWDKVTSKWENEQAVFNFFERNKQLLMQPYFKSFGITKEQAREQVFREALNIREVLKRACESRKKSESLDSFFKPLDDNKAKLENVFQTKGKSNLKLKHRLLRVYAIRIDENIYVLTGGAIKLVWKMNQQDETYIELGKLQRVRNYLNYNGVVDNDSFYELIYDQDE